MNKKHHCNNPSPEQMHTPSEAEAKNITSSTPETAEENTQIPAEPNADLQEALTECAAWKDKALRAQADMENLRKRMAHDMENHTKFAHGSFAKDLLPVADCLANALTCAHQELKNPDNKAFLKNMITGIEMVQ
ncbi:MAG: nucleotide exchange factor GrpE, partial [Alphaproteobacteria bacterium]